jgi:HK97 family phage portal protein
MGLFSRVHTRALTYESLMATAPDVAALWKGRQSSTGVTITGDSILSYSAVWAAVNLISSDVGSLPLFHYKRAEGGGKTRQYGSRLFKMLRMRPNPEMGAMVFRKTLQVHLLLAQRAFAEIERNGMGQPIALWPIVPDRVRPARDGGGKLYYTVTNPAGGEVSIPAADMIHLVGASHDGVGSIPLVDKAKESIGLSLAMEKQGNTFFANGSTFGGVVEHPLTFSPDGRKNFLESIEGRHQGIDKAHRILLLEESAKWVPANGVAPQNAQFNETRTFQLDEVARWFQIPPHKLANLLRATFSNIEHLDLDYYKSCLRQWLTLWQEELWAKLIPSLEQNQETIEFLIDAILLGDITSRYAAYAVGRQWGWLSADDIRERENMNPLPGGQGKIYLVPQNMWPADRVDKMIDAQSAKPALPPAPDPTPEPEDDRFGPLLEAIRTIDQRIERAEATSTTWQARAEAAEAEARTLRNDKTANEATIAAAEATAVTLRAEAAQIALLKAELEGEKGTLATQLEDLRSQIAVRDAELAEAQTSRDEAVEQAARMAQEKATAEDVARAADEARDAAERAVVAATGALEALRTEVATAQDRVSAAVRDQALSDEARQALAAEVEQARARVVDAETVRNQRVVEADAARLEADELQAKVIELTAREAALLADVTAGTETIARLEAEMAQFRSTSAESLEAKSATIDALMVDALNAQAATAREAESSEALRVQLAATEAQRQANEARLQEALESFQRAITAFEQERAEAQARVSEAERMARDAETRVQLATEARAAETAGRARECRLLHSRIVREMRKALEREGDKARRHQQSPEKLRTGGACRVASGLRAVGRRSARDDPADGGFAYPRVTAADRIRARGRSGRSLDRDRTATASVGGGTSHGPRGSAARGGVGLCPALSTSRGFCRCPARRSM